jgi:hypothetical protein
VARLPTALFAVLGAAVPLVLLGVYHAAAFGSPLALPYDFSVWETPKTGWFMGIGKPNFTSLHDILLGEYRGLLSTTPWLGLAVPGAIVLAKRRGPEVAVCAASIVLFLWLNSSIPPWHGGWAAGPRYLVPMLPFLALLAGGSLAPIGARLESSDESERASGMVLAAALGGLIVYGAANMFAATAVKPEIPTAEKRPYSGFVWPNFRKGELSISTQSIDMIDNPRVGPKQAFNLGMKAGLVGHASLLPLAGWVLLCGLWLAWAVRVESRTRTAHAA